MSARSLLYGFGALLYRILLALGIGGTTMFILFAPVLFGVLPESVENGRHLAGVIVNKTLIFVQLWGMGGGTLMVALGAALYWKRDRPWQRWSRLGGATLIALLSAVSMFVVADEMNALRSQMGVIDLVPLDDARRVAFNQLHRVSSTVHLIAMLANVFLIALPLPGGSDGARGASQVE